MDGPRKKGPSAATMFATSRDRREPLRCLACTFLAKCLHMACNPNTSPTPSDMTTWTTSSSGRISKAMSDASPLGVFECVLWACCVRERS